MQSSAQGVTMLFKLIAAAKDSWACFCLANLIPELNCDKAWFSLTYPYLVISLFVRNVSLKYGLDLIKGYFSFD